MSHHLSGPNLRPPREDARLDLTDTYAFTNGDRTVLVHNANPFAPKLADAFHPDAVHQINVDTDDDNIANVVYSLVFSDPADGPQTYTLYRGDHRPERPDDYGEQLVHDVPVAFDGSLNPESSGDLTVWVGTRSDAFFADLEGIGNDFQWTGRDTMANLNVFSIVLEQPSAQLGNGPTIGVWNRVSVVEDGGLVSVDRGAHPSVTAYFNETNEAKNAYNEGSPDTDWDTYLEPWSKVLAHTAHFDSDAAEQTLREILPDVLRFDRSRPAVYPNGRSLTDDVTSHRLNMVSGGKITTDNIPAHTDLLQTFPYLGKPHPTPDGPPN